MKTNNTAEDQKQVAKEKQPAFFIGVRVRTPEGPGTIKEESAIGEFRVKLDGKGFCWYFEEDLIEAEINEN